MCSVLHTFAVYNFLAEFVQHCTHIVHTLKGGFFVQSVIFITKKRSGKNTLNSLNKPDVFVNDLTLELLATKQKLFKIVPLYLTDIFLYLIYSLCDYIWISSDKWLQQKLHIKLQKYMFIYVKNSLHCFELYIKIW